LELIRPDINIDFVGKRKYAYLFSTVVIILGLLSFAVKGKITLGIDFQGGMLVQVRFTKPVVTEDIRQALEPLGENLIVQRFSAGGEEFIIRADAPEGGSEGLTSKVKELLEKKTGSGTVEIRGAEMVGPKVGKDLRESAMWATVVALGMLLIYVGSRFGLSMAFGAVLCLVHDAMVVYGLFVWTGREFNLTILAAILTVIGYDVNDSIVVCDRIRENLASMRGKTLDVIVNTSINQTLSRTILTGGFTLLVIAALLFLATGVLRDFALALGVGIIFGTYSSIYVAAPLVLAWDRIMPVKRL
jgi:preprotein translocase subunit SecF